MYSQTRRPPELKGKEIGLYYRNKNIERQQKNTPEMFKLSSEIEQKIKFILFNSRSFYNSVSYENLKSARISKYHQIHDNQFKRKFFDIIYGDIQHNLAKAMNGKSKLQRNSDVDRILQNEYREKQSQDAYQNMLKFRLKLPAYKKRSEILQLIEDHQVVVVSGETGKLQNLEYFYNFYNFYNFIIL